MPTKKELAERYQITDNTVYKTLKACGLDTARTEYTEEEVQERFEKARAMMDAGKKYKDIEAYFNIRSSGGGVASQNGSTRHQGQRETPTTHSQTAENNFTETIRGEIYQSTEEAVKEAVRDIIPHIPRMAAEELNRLSQGGAISKAFQQFRNDYIAGQQSYNTSGGLPGSSSINDKEQVVDVDVEIAAEDETDTDNEPI